MSSVTVAFTAFGSTTALSAAVGAATMIAGAPFPESETIRLGEGLVAGLVSYSLISFALWRWFNKGPLKVVNLSRRNVFS